MSGGDIQSMLTRLTGEDAEAADELLPIVYDQMHAMAVALMQSERPAHTLQATALVNEAYLKLVGHQQRGWNGRIHFLAVAARAMRQVLADHANARNALKRGGRLAKLTFDSSIAGEACDVDILELNEALTELESFDERHARVVELRFFGGLSVDEVAQVLDLSPRTVQLDWRVARAWLLRRLRG